jgi:hypothetical protein
MAQVPFSVFIPKSQTVTLAVCSCVTGDFECGFFAITLAFSKLSHKSDQNNFYCYFERLYEIIKLIYLFLQSWHDDCCCKGRFYNCVQKEQWWITGSEP